MHGVTSRVEPERVRAHDPVVVGEPGEHARVGGVRLETGDGEAELHDRHVVDTLGGRDRGLERCALVVRRVHADLDVRGTGIRGLPELEVERARRRRHDAEGNRAVGRVESCRVAHLEQGAVDAAGREHLDTGVEVAQVDERQDRAPDAVGAVRRVALARCAAVVADRGVVALGVAVEHGDVIGGIGRHGELVDDGLDGGVEPVDDGTRQAHLAFGELLALGVGCGLLVADRDRRDDGHGLGAGFDGDLLMRGERRAEERAFRRRARARPRA